MRISPTSDWPAPDREKALCRGSDTARWFPHKGDNRGNQSAMAICRKCEVRADCLAYGINEAWGIWGGTTLFGRRHVRRKMRRAGRDFEPEQMLGLLLEWEKQQP